jgi:hypothetical protein
MSVTVVTDAPSTIVVKETRISAFVCGAMTVKVKPPGHNDRVFLSPTTQAEDEEIVLVGAMLPPPWRAAPVVTERIPAWVNGSDSGAGDGESTRLGVEQLQIAARGQGGVADVVKVADFRVRDHSLARKALSVPVMATLPDTKWSQLPASALRTGTVSHSLPASRRARPTTCVGNVDRLDDHGRVAARVSRTNLRKSVARPLLCCRHVTGLM